MTSTRGFTLIELLVVIAIIGILSSVVLASLNTARDRATNVNIQSNLANTRAEAELFYSFGNTYEGVCALTGTSTIGDSIQAADVSFDGTAPIYDDAEAADVANGQCHDSAAAWAATVPLKNSDGYFCVDNNGQATTTTALGANVFTCP